MLLTFYINMFCLLLAPPLLLVMRQMARRDEMVFRLLNLRLHFSVRVRNRRLHGGAWVFTPNSTRRRRDPR